MRDEHRDEHEPDAGGQGLQFNTRFGKPPPPEVLAQLPVIPNQG